MSASGAGPPQMAMRHHTFPELERTNGPWRKIAKVLLVLVVFSASFAFAFFKIGPWAKEFRSRPEEAVLSDARSSQEESAQADSADGAGPSASRVWITPHEESRPDGGADEPEPTSTPSTEWPDAGTSQEGGETGPEDMRDADQEPEAGEEPSLPPRITTTLYRVQLGVFSDRERAQDLSDGLVGKGYSTYVTQTQSDGQVLYKVQVGAFEDESNARALASELEAAGYEVVVTSSSG